MDRYLATAREQLPELEVGWIELQQYGDENAVVDVAGSVPGVVAHHAHVVMRADNAELLTVSAPGARVKYKGIENRTRGTARTPHTRVRTQLTVTRPPRARLSMSSDDTHVSRHARCDTREDTHTRLCL